MPTEKAQDVIARLDKVDLSGIKTMQDELYFLLDNFPDAHEVLLTAIEDGQITGTQCDLCAYGHVLGNDGKTCRDVSIYLEKRIFSTDSINRFTYLVTYIIDVLPASPDPGAQRKARGQKQWIKHSRPNSDAWLKRSPLLPQRCTSSLP